MSTTNKHSANGHSTNGNASTSIIPHEMTLRVVDSPKVWTTLITNTTYLPGLLVLAHALKEVGSAYPLIALTTDAFPPEGHAALARRGIPTQKTPYLLPSTEKDYTHDPRFYDCWSKLTPWGLTGYDRVVQLDSDMLPLHNMDELMHLPLDSPELKGKGNRVFAASHACVCNPRKKAHYPKTWVPSACAFTSQHTDPTAAQSEGAGIALSFGMPNGGLQVVNPCADIYADIMAQLSNPEAIASYDFADQSMLGDLFAGRWVSLSYKYNALKTLRDCHSEIWRDDLVKNVHYILSPKPWDEDPANPAEVSHGWWHEVNKRRLADEKKRGIDDGF